MGNRRRSLSRRLGTGVTLSGAVAKGAFVGLAKNERLNALAQPWRARSQAEFKTTAETQRLFADLRYAAHRWDHPRRVICKAEHTEKGSNPRYIVTNLEADAQRLYERLYCARGEMENRIKERAHRGFLTVGAGGMVNSVIPHLRAQCFRKDSR